MNEIANNVRAKVFIAECFRSIGEIQYAMNFERNVEFQILLSEVDCETFELLQSIQDNQIAELVGA